MKKFGLIGGTSWRSTLEYYKSINSQCNDYFKNNTNPPLYIANINQSLIHQCQKENDWGKIAEVYLEKSKELESLGVQGLAFCANTPHRIYDEIQQEISIPILHIADSIAEEVKNRGMGKAGLLGTAITMQGEFIKGRLQTNYGINILTPESEIQTKIQTFLYDEMSVGIFSEPCRKFFEEVVESLTQKGAEAVILACTEFPLLLQKTTSRALLINSLESHCSSIVDFILSPV